MIWNSVINGYPEVDCKCDVLVKRKDGDLKLFFAEYDPYIKRFLIKAITDANKEEFESVYYWRAL